MFRFNQAEKKNLLLAAALVVFLIVLDLWVKILAVDYLIGAPGFSYLGGFIVVEYAENRGAFLSLGANLSETARLWIFVVGVIFILGFCLYSLIQSAASRTMTLAFALVISGGIGNLIDRIKQGYVVDYVHMGFTSVRTGVFNVADVAISAGLIWLIYLQYKAEPPKENAKEKRA